jgi:hypothetical protein
MSYDFTPTQHIGMNANGTYAGYGKRSFALMVNPETCAVETRSFSVLLNQARSGDKTAIAELQFRGNSTIRKGNF